ncbi:hypothetical protein E2562_033845 [Oryza meyeriana var. granulata]|uniref:Uncharacterized protein n=1 Tax=Oryza meyeriana var. granulata TaxID=110450 RepID=A0A6G1BPG7_9ORYZ|nr:hypothetical protein E2562_033845 [Oryza meyeriana var. granulata]
MAVRVGVGEELGLNAVEDAGNGAGFVELKANLTMMSKRRMRERMVLACRLRYACTYAWAVAPEEAAEKPNSELRQAATVAAVESPH